jgi:hypothetical protein
MNIPPSSNQHKKWDSTDDLNTNLNKHNNNANLSFGIKNDSLDLPKNYEPIRNRPSSKSIYDEKGSEDNRSVRSGATARASFTGGLDNLDFLKIPSNADNNPSEWPSTGSLRGMMKPPLRKRN